jgi:Leucine Rich repeat
MQYERMLFGMKISDASSIASALPACSCLTSLILSSNLIDDDLLRMLMAGLAKGATLTHLDVSHNRITNHGARLLSKLLGAKSALTSLSLADNQIHAEGGRYLGRALRTNDALSSLNLRLNRYVYALLALQSVQSVYIVELRQSQSQCSTHLRVFASPLVQCCNELSALERVVELASCVYAVTTTVPLLILVDRTSCATTAHSRPAQQCYTSTHYVASR